MWMVFGVIAFLYAAVHANPVDNLIAISSNKNVKLDSEFSEPFEKSMT